MLRLHNIKLPLSYSGQSLAQAAAKALSAVGTLLVTSKQAMHSTREAISPIGARN